MKTQIVHLDESDDLISIRDKLMGVKTSRLVLAFPYTVRVLKRSLDFILLKRYARRIGVQLAVVTTNPNTISHCKTLQIPCFSSQREAQEKEWHSQPLSIPIINSNNKISKIIQTRMDRIGETKPLSTSRRITILGVIIFSIIILGMIFLPSATITIHPVEINQKRLISLTAGEIMERESESFHLPLEELSIKFSDSLVAQTSGSMIIAEDFATGIIRFENLTENAVGIPAGSIVMSSDTPSLKYLTQEDVVIPAGVGEQVEIGARAQEAGLSSNIGINEVFVVEGILGSMVAASNPIPFEGGGEIHVPTATDADWYFIESTLMQQIVDDCSDKIIQFLAEGDVFLPGSDVITVNRKEMFPPDIQPAEFISLVLDVECKGKYVNQKSILDTTTRLLDKDLSPGSVPVGKLIITSTSSIVKTENMYQWTIKAERLVKTHVDPGKLRLLIMGKNKETVSGLIKEYLSLSTTPEILLAPRWWSTLPVVAWRISIVIDE